MMLQRSKAQKLGRWAPSTGSAWQSAEDLPHTKGTSCHAQHVPCKVKPSPKSLQMGKKGLPRKTGRQRLKGLVWRFSERFT